MRAEFMTPVWDETTCEQQTRTTRSRNHEGGRGAVRDRLVEHLNLTTHVHEHLTGAIERDSRDERVGNRCHRRTGCGDRQRIDGYGVVRRRREELRYRQRQRWWWRLHIR